MKPTAVGVFIFAGGFTLGVKRAGFDVLAQLEDGPFGVASTRANHPKLPVVTDPAEWPTALAGLEGGKIGFMYGNPPCAPFSNAAVSKLKAGHFNDYWKRDPRASCITKMFGLLESHQPTVWAWESVQGAWRKGRELVDELTEVARAHGYSATYLLLNAAHLGVPQIRRRFFCVFHKVAIPWRYPRVKEEMTVARALKGLDPGDEIMESGALDKELMPTVAQGKGPRDAWEALHPPSTWKFNKHGGVKGRPAFSTRRLRAATPSCTIIGGAHLYHPTEHRFLSLREQQVLCGYPPDYQFVAMTLGDKYAQVARAVMPPIGEWLARNVRRGLEQDERLRRPGVYLANFEKGEPIVELVRRAA